MNTIYRKQLLAQKSTALKIAIAASFGLMCVGQIRIATGQACIICRTEKCPTKEGMSEWCGSGPDPMVAPNASQTARPTRKTRLLELRITTEPPGAKLQIDGQALPALSPLQTPLGKGWHRIEASLAGHSTTTVNVNLLQSGQEIVVRLPSGEPAVALSPPSLSPAREAVEPAGSPPQDPLDHPAARPVAGEIAPVPTALNSEPGRPGRSLLIGGGILAGLGLVGVAAGIGLYSADSANHSEFTNSTDEMEKLTIRQRGQTLNGASIASYSVGAIALVSGTALLITGALARSRAKKQYGLKRQAMFAFSGDGLLVTVVGDY